MLQLRVEICYLNMLLLHLILADGEGAIPDLPATSNALGFLSLHQEVGERYKRQV